uniref:Uncharacterized protein n=1 Tax=Anguilla anguilla TaxID=7936 RepID=A0A0E9PE80_ANGAN
MFYSILSAIVQLHCISFPFYYLPLPSESILQCCCNDSKQK